MNDINIINEEWELIENCDLEDIPEIGHYIYLRSKESYFRVKMVIHDIYYKKILWFRAPRHTISIVVERFSNIKEVKNK
jgi:hypothetical protein